MTLKVQLLDYGVGNLGSIIKMIRYLGHDVERITKPQQVERATKLILPGVGAFDNAMHILNKSKLVAPLNELALQRKIPVIGICLGMQLLGKGSEEGELEGLGWIDMHAKRFTAERCGEKIKVPHMGWSHVEVRKKNVLFDEMRSEPRFYFVHSYYLECNDQNDVATTSRYGVEFASTISKDNIFGAQYHPEKSHKFGMQLFRNFLERV